MKTKLKIKQGKGITLIALVVTIVVLLILAGVSISLVLNNNGVISKAKDAKYSTERGQAQDEVNLAINYLQIEDATSTLTREDRRKILEDELRKISADSSVSISGLGYKITHKKYDFFVDKDLKISSSGKTFDAVEWDKKAAPEDIFIWKSDDPNNADYGVIIGYKKNVDNYTVLRFPSRCTNISTYYNYDVYKYYDDNEPTIRSYTKNILKVEMPDTITELGIGAFSSSSKIGPYSYQYGFYFSSLEKVELSKSLSKIEDYAFSGCQKLKIEIPENITEIGANAFYMCKASENIEIPDSVSKIGSNAFEGLKTIQIGKIVETEDGLNNGALGCETLIIRDGVKKLIKCSGDFLNVEIPKSVNEIGSGCFEYNDKLESFTIPESVNEIADSCFERCTNLKQINIPESVNKIGDSSFAGCTSLQQINIPKSVNKIGRASFSNCTNLQQINIPEGVNEIGDECFYECEKLQQVNLPEGLKKIGYRCFEDCEKLQQINLPEGLEEIGSRAFYETSSLSEIIIPKSVKTIKSCAFGRWNRQQTIKCKATEAGENWDEHWNYSFDAFQGGYLSPAYNIIWGYQDSNT